MGTLGGFLGGLASGIKQSAGGNSGASGQSSFGGLVPMLYNHFHPAAQQAQPFSSVDGSADPLGMNAPQPVTGGHVGGIASAPISSPQAATNAIGGNAPGPGLPTVSPFIRPFTQSNNGVGPVAGESNQASHGLIPQFANLLGLGGS
jgi:hypothetical protein